MAGEWKEVPFADVIELISGGTPKTSVPEYWEGSIPWLSVSDFNTGYRWVSSAEKTITERGLSESATTILNQGDIIISARGTVGVLAQLAKPMAFNQSCYGVRGKRGITETNFVYYALRHAVSQMQQFAHGGVFNTITRETFKIIRTKLPPLPEQRAIACILGALDDKIELNRRMNETLEQIAQAIFKIWFIEPTKNGKLPEGWREGKISDICSTQYGFTASATDKPIGPYFLRVTDINKQNWINWTNVPHCSISNEDKQKYKLHVGDILVARMADPGKSAIVEQEVDAVFASYLVRLKTKSLAHAYYLFYFLKSPVYLNYSEAARSGSVQANMNAKVIVDASLPIPSSILIEGFFAKVLPIRKRIIYNLTQSATLAALRDTLLPKLLSGELRVPDAEKICARGASALGGMERCV